MEEAPRNVSQNRTKGRNPGMKGGSLTHRVIHWQGCPESQGETGRALNPAAPKRRDETLRVHRLAVGLNLTALSWGGS